MKRIIKNILTVFFVAILMVACKDAQPEVNTDLMNSEVVARETLVAADAYWHGDVYGSGSYKITLTLLSQDMTIDHSFSADDKSELFTGFGGTGYAFELEFNSESLNTLVPGVYSADTIGKVNGKNAYLNDIFTYHPEHSYVVVAHNGNNVKQMLSPDTKVTVSLSDGIYTVTIDGKNALGIPLKGSYVGAINLNDIDYYREPTTPKTINVIAESVSYSPEEANDYYSENGKYTIHWLTIEGINGEVGIFMFQGLASDLTSLTSDTYGFEDGKYDLSISLSSEENPPYDTNKAYREDGRQTGSFISIDGNIYYLWGEFDIEMNASGTSVESLKVNATSLNGGSNITIEYTKPTAE